MHVVLLHMIASASTLDFFIKYVKAIASFSFELVGEQVVSIVILTCKLFVLRIRIAKPKIMTFGKNVVSSKIPPLHIRRLLKAMVLKIPQ